MSKIVQHKEYYKKVFLHKFRNFRSFEDQLNSLNNELGLGEEYAYKYNGDILPVNDETYDFRHLMLEYFFKRKDLDSKIGLGIGIDDMDVLLNGNKLIEWVPFNDMSKEDNDVDFIEDEYKVYTGKKSNTSLRTYPDFFNVFQNTKTISKNWLEHFRVNKEAFYIISKDFNIDKSSLNEPITSFYIYLADIDRPFPQDIISCDYVTTKCKEAYVTDYNKVAEAIEKSSTYSEINFLDPLNKHNDYKDIKTVEAVWQVKEIENNNTVLAVCKSDDEKNIVHEKFTNDERYEISIPLNNIFSDLDEDDTSLLPQEQITFTLSGMVQVEGEMFIPLSSLNDLEGGDGCLSSYGMLMFNPLEVEQQEDIWNQNPTTYAKNHIITDMLDDISTLDISTIVKNLYERFYDKMLVMGKTNIKAIPYDIDRKVAYSEDNNDKFLNFADDKGYVPMDVIARDLVARTGNGSGGGEGETYPWEDNGVLRKTLYKQVKIETDWHASIVTNVKFEPIYEEDVSSSEEILKDVEITMELNPVSLNQLKTGTSPLGWLYGKSTVPGEGLYEKFGEANSLSKYITSFRFFDLSIHNSMINVLDNDILDPRFRFFSNDTFGSYCRTIDSNYFKTVSGLENRIGTMRTKIDNTPTLSALLTPDFQTYLGVDAGSGLWQKGLEIILDCQFNNIIGFSELFDLDDPVYGNNYFVFRQTRRNLTEYDFDVSNKPTSDDDNLSGFYNWPKNTQPTDKLFTPLHMMFIPYRVNRFRERIWCNRLAQEVWENSSGSYPYNQKMHTDIDTETMIKALEEFKCYILYKEEKDGGEDYVKDFTGDEFGDNIDFKVDYTGDVGDEEHTSPREWEFLYMWRPVRHFIQLGDTYYKDSQDPSTYEFDLSYLYVNNIDDTSINNDVISKLIEDITPIENPDLINTLMSKTSHIGTFYYEITNSSIQLITPSHVLYPFTIINPVTNEPPVFFKLGEKVNICYKGVIDNKNSAIIISPTAGEIVNGISLAYNNSFRNIQTEFVKNDDDIYDKAYNPLDEPLHDMSNDLKAPYADLWVKVGDVNDDTYEGGYTITNHNYLIHNGLPPFGALFAGKQWDNNIGLHYTYIQPQQAHFFIDDSSNVNVKLQVPDINQIENKNLQTTLYLGTAIIPPSKYFNLNESVINIDTGKESIIEIIKNDRKNDVVEIKAIASIVRDENNRENLDGLIFTSYGKFIQYIQLEQKQTFITTMPIQIGMTVYVGDEEIGLVDRIHQNPLAIIVHLFNKNKYVEENDEITIKFKN